MTDYMTPDQIIQELRCVTYKPGWEFTWHTHPFDGLTLRITFSAPNVYRVSLGADETGDMQEQGINVPIPPLMSRAQFHDWLMWRLKIIELHELQEFYWVNDKIYRDPHNPDYMKEVPAQ
jgi:hypothetical protein